MASQNWARSGIALAIGFAAALLVAACQPAQAVPHAATGMHQAIVLVAERTGTVAAAPAPALAPVMAVHPPLRTRGAVGATPAVTDRSIAALRYFIAPASVRAPPAKVCSQL